MSDIFISYATEDKGRIEPLARAFIADGMSVVWDHSLNAGRSWLREADQAIREAAVVVVVWTSGSVESQWIRDEAQLAQSLGTLLPVQLDMTRSAQPIAFRSMQVFDLSDWDGQSTDDHLKQLIAVVRRRLKERYASPSSSPAASPPPMPPLLYPNAAPAQPAATPAPTYSWPVPPPVAAVPSPSADELEIPAFLRRRTTVSPLPAPAPASIPPPAPIVSPSIPAPLPQTATAPQAELLPSPATALPPDVFVAYSRKDEAVCKQVVMALRSEGLNVFYDQYIEGGQEWREIIAQNIKSCSVFMVLFSANSLKSDQVRKEVNHATDNSRSVVPVMIENVKLDGGLALELNGINFIPFFDNPASRLPEVVEKARNLAAIAVFDRRRDYFQAGEANAFVPARGVTAISQAAASARPALWGRGVVAIAGAMVLSFSMALAAARFSGQIAPEWIAVIAIALFFVALPYVIGVMMLFGRLIRGS